MVSWLIGASFPTCSDFTPFETSTQAALTSTCCDDELFPTHRRWGSLEIQQAIAHLANRPKKPHHMWWIFLELQPMSKWTSYLGEKNRKNMQKWIFFQTSHLPVVVGTPGEDCASPCEGQVVGSSSHNHRDPSADHLQKLLPRFGVTHAWHKLLFLH